MASYFERSLQDTANVTTISGVPALGVVRIIKDSLPRAAIARGHDNLRVASDTLIAEESIPPEEEKVYFKEHDKLFKQGLELAKDGETKSIFRYKEYKKYWNETSDFEDKTAALRTNVQRTSDMYRSLRGRRYAPSTHTVESTADWERIEPPSPSLYSSVACTASDVPVTSQSSANEVIPLEDIAHVAPTEDVRSAADEVVTTDVEDVSECSVPTIIPPAPCHTRS